MGSVITQSVTLPAPAQELFDMYLEPSIHGAFTGHPVKIGKESGSEFYAFEGQLRGTILVTIPSRLIVQSWRSVNFKPDDEDSMLILAFSEANGEGGVDLIHIGVPDHEIEPVSIGWESYYWVPWRDYLQHR
jgi:activator of HSP90 ATPase